MDRIAFVCQHGAAKSVIAAELYRSLAARRGRVAVATAFGIEPDPEVPGPVVDGLGRDGIDVAGRIPVEVGAEPLADADLVILIGCDLPAGVSIANPVVRWDDVPAVSDDFEAARAAIMRRLEQLLDDRA
jgi:protein-tyrosine-phosphatase